MSDFRNFMADKAEQIQNIRFAASPRFKDDEGKPLEWEMRCVDAEEDKALRKECTKRIIVKKGVTTPETDYELYALKLAVRCTVYPDLENTELQDSYKVMGAVNLLLAMLTPGELANYLKQAQEINGFDASFEDLVGEAKNS